jgi:hypothetical protein
MYGSFVVSRDNKIAFSVMQNEAEIAEFIYFAEQRMMNIVFADGKEEMLTSEIETPVHEVLVKNDTMIVGHITDNQLVKEYTAKLVFI